MAVHQSSRHPLAHSPISSTLCNSLLNNSNEPILSAPLLPQQREEKILGIKELPHKPAMEGPQSAICKAAAGIRKTHANVQYIDQAEPHM